MIFTSYYAKMRNFPVHLVPVSISRGVPKWYNGLTYEKLAPLWETVTTYKENVANDPIYWEKWYEEQYNATVLDNLDQNKVAVELQRMVGEGNIPVLLCYEKSADFCHRVLVADWFEKANILAREATANDFTNIKEKESDGDLEK